MACLMISVVLLLQLALTPTTGNLFAPWSSWGRSLLGGLPRFLPEAKVLVAEPSTQNDSRATRYHADSDKIAELKSRCALARGTWCGEYLRQERVPFRPVPRGSKECPNACSGWGNCNYDWGLCDCPAGRGGADCGLEVKRPCAHEHRGPDDYNNAVPRSSVGPDGLDMDVTKPGWTASRCFGYCWTDVAACFCGEGRYRHIPPPPGSPPWTPPVQWGRPIADSCQPRTNARGQPTFNPHSGLSYDDIYGPVGWCNSLDSHRCDCFLELAPPCDGSQPMETTCVNQCSGHGDCFFGYCRCHAGWYGADCSRKKAGLEMEEGFHTQRPWLQQLVATPPAALDPPPTTARPRPLIYVYDIPPEYTSRMLQYRLVGGSCVWRRFHPGNVTGTTPWTYGIEMLLHELFLQSEHRTFDPEEADFFYVPMYIGCYFWPVMGWADTPYWYSTNGLRVMHGANMITELHGWLRSTFPWWDRRGGRDHIWLMAHDEGACWMPTDVFKASIVLTHWGRMDAVHESATAFPQDNYSVSDADLGWTSWSKWRGQDFKDRIRGHPCYDPKKDLIIPAFKPPGHFHASPLLGAAPLERDILLYFRGDLGEHRLPRYSRGIRQKLFDLSMKHDWYGKYNIVLASGGMLAGDYSQHLARSKFCLVAPGDGWSPRAEDAVLHGCVPLVIMDNVHAVWESLLDWESFSVRIRESALEAVPQILTAIPPERLARMQRNLARVWHRFAYSSFPLLRHGLESELAGNRARLREHVPEGRTTPPDHPFQPATSFNHEDDAFHTILQWLYHRINATR